MINVSHRAQSITTRFGDGTRFGLRIDWSHEAEPLETAGGIAQARTLLGPEPFLLVNADIWCDYDFSRLHDFGLGKRLAHLVLVPNPPHHPQGDFALRDGRVAERGEALLTFSGIGLYAPSLFARIAPGSKAQLAPLLRAAMREGAVGGELHAGRWMDVGTPGRLAELDRILSGL